MDFVEQIFFVDKGGDCENGQKNWFGFAFLDFFDHLKTLRKYFGPQRQTGYLDKQLDSFVEVKKIDSGTVFLKDGSIRAVIQVVPLHFSLLSPEEQRAIISAYRDFLNSLDFPVQIVMRTINLSLNEYLAVLQKKVENNGKQGLKTQFESFKQFVENFIAEKKIKNRVFYIIVPVSAFHGFFGASQKLGKKTLSDQLDIRVKICQEKLKRCNLFSKRLDSTELVSLLASFFEGFIEAQNEYFSTLTTLKDGEKIEEKKRAWFNALGQKIEPSYK